MLYLWHIKTAITQLCIINAELLHAKEHEFEGAPHTHNTTPPCWHCLYPAPALKMAQKGDHLACHKTVGQM